MGSEMCIRDSYKINCFVEHVSNCLTECKFHVLSYFVMYVTLALPHLSACRLVERIGITRSWPFLDPENSIDTVENKVTSFCVPRCVISTNSYGSKITESSVFLESFDPFLSSMLPVSYHTALCVDSSLILIASVVVAGVLAVVVVCVIVILLRRFCQFVYQHYFICHNFMYTVLIYGYSARY